ncbi:S-adenosyl-L-methionine-dependent methyltransferase [Pilobolus umbonatus]|nr:S-adenosyl-L-methionine-dependent methyltransferase [Pilobolus umbonatus]
MVRLLPVTSRTADNLHIISNYHSPIKKQLEEGIKVMDAGCGPATWTFDMAENYPNSHFTGVDVSFVFPESIRPANVDLQIHNIGRPLAFPENSFDFYYQRLVFLGLTDADWDVSIQNAYRILKPGGYCELVEPNMNEFYQRGPLTTQLQHAMTAISLKKGLVPTISLQLDERLKKAGFINIHYRPIPLPLNHTNKIGQLLWDDCYRGYTNMRPMMALVDSSYEDPDFYKKHLTDIAEECARLQTNLVVYIAYGQKPY